MEIEYNVNDENRKVLEEVCEKYGYSEELKNVLSRIMVAMLEGATYEERTLFYSMLRKTPIEIIPANSTITLSELNKKYYGEINPHIVEDKDVDTGEYNKTKKPAGAFSSQIEYDENLNIKGVKQFLFIRELEKKRAIDELGTKINVPHLIHELGHAWASEKNSYSIENGIITRRRGTFVTKSELIPNEDGKYKEKVISMTGLMLEEALNTNMEEDSVARYLGKPLEDVKKMYSNQEAGTFEESVYQRNNVRNGENVCSKNSEKELKKMENRRRRIST